MRELLKRLDALHPGSLKAYCYDGFISAVPLSDQQIADLESHIRRRSGTVLGVELAITLKATPFGGASKRPDGTDSEPLTSGPTGPKSCIPWYDLSSLHIEKKPNLVT